VKRLNQYPGRDLNPQDTRVSGDFESAALEGNDTIVAALPANGIRHSPTGYDGDRTRRRTRPNALPLPLRLGGGNTGLVS
jgi:hypothetical protein